jgi:hypothetical protein
LERYGESWRRWFRFAKHQQRQNTTGAVDYVKLKNGQNKLVYEDEFDE